MDRSLVKLSKFLSLVLRHQPETIGLTLDEKGWAQVEQLLDLASQKGVPLERFLLEKIVETNDKKRFSFNADKSKIRANQGHSIAVELDLSVQQPPEILFHGTATRFIASIRDRGLLAGKRQHVHLSSDEATAVKVGQRHGKPIVLRIRARELFDAEFLFFLSNNQVWLTERVPAKYIEFPNS